MDKIYSRKRIIIPNANSNKNRNKRLINISKFIYIIFVALITFNIIIQSISPIIDKQCVNLAKSIATKVTNEQTTKVMTKYKYDDLCNITKDSMRKYNND